MKKFLSVLLTMAMVMSLFTGTVLAADPAAFTVSVGTATKDLDMKDFTLPGDVVDYTIYLDDPLIGTVGVVDPGEAKVVKTGVTIPASNILAVETSALEVAKTADLATYKLLLANKTAVRTTATVTIAVKVYHVLTVNNVTSNPTVVLGQRNVFTGTLMNRGAAVSNKQVALFDGATVLGLATTDSNGAFSFDAPINSAKVYNIYVGAESYMTTKMTVTEDIKVTAKNAPITIRDAANTVDVEFTNVSGAPALVASLFHLVNITRPDGTVIALKNPAGGTTTYTVPTQALGALQAGTYKVDVALYLTDPSAGNGKIADSTTYKPYRSGTTSFEVKDNSAALYTTVSIADANPIVVGTNVYTKDVPVSSTVPYFVDFAFIAAGDGTVTISKVVYKVTGPVVKEMSGTKGSLTVSNPTFTTAESFLVNGDGVLTISGTVTYSNDKTETFEKTVTVKGLNAVYSPEDLGNVNDEVDLSVVLTNDSGVPVNNAKVTITSTNYAGFSPDSAFKVWNGTSFVAVGATANNNVINGQTTVIQNGTYAKKIKLAEPGEITVKVEYYDGAWKEAAYTKKIVYGADVYTAEAVTNLIATKTGQTVTFKLTNADGVSIKPTYAYLEDTKGISGLTNPLTTPYTYSDNNLQLTFAPSETGSFNVLLGTDNGAKMVVVPVNVVAPTVVVKVDGVESTKVTAGILNKIEVVFADVAASTISVATAKVDGNVYTDAGSTVLPATKATTNGVVTFYAKNTIFKSETEGTLEISANFGVAGKTVKVATLKVVKPILTTGVESLEVGTVVDLNLLLTDANGKGLKGYEIKSAGSDAFAGNATVKTDEAGKAILTVSPNAPGTLTLEVSALKPFDNDDTVGDTTYANSVKYTMGIPVVRDTKGPVFEMDAVYSVTTMPATINFNVKDGSKVTEVWVGYEKAMVRPDGSVVFTATGLPVGVTEFDVLAYDYYGNASEATLVIEYLKPATVVLTIGSTDATKDGAAMTGMDQAPTIVNGRTFLPVRFVFVNLLGGTIEWDATTQTITSVVKGNTIKMVVGSKTAFVNGNAVALLEAPYIEAATGRTLVPMREIMEAIGISLTWNATTQTVSIVIPQ